jgi:hypothetical protein
MGCPVCVVRQHWSYSYLEKCTQSGLSERSSSVFGEPGQSIRSSVQAGEGGSVLTRAEDVDMKPQHWAEQQVRRRDNE